MRSQTAVLCLRVNSIYVHLFQVGEFFDVLCLNMWDHVTGWKRKSFIRSVWSNELQEKLPKKSSFVVSHKRHILLYWELLMGANPSILITLTIDLFLT